MKVIPIIYTALRTFLNLFIGTAHAQAYEKAKIVHRDISEANIMVRRDGDKIEGVLIDWDLCEELEKGYNAGRTVCLHSTIELRC